MTAASVLPAFTDYLVALAATSLPTITCYDGPPVTQAPVQSYIAIGWDGSLETAENGSAFAPGGAVATFEREWNYLGSMAHQEMIDITCAVVVWNGGTSNKTVRDLAFGYLSTFEQALRNALDTDPVLQAMSIPDCLVQRGIYSQTQEGKAVVASIEFNISNKARI